MMANYCIYQLKALNTVCLLKDGKELGDALAKVDEYKLYAGTLKLTVLWLECRSLACSFQLLAIQFVLFGLCPCISQFFVLLL